jgi:subtilisin family serine protease
VVQTNPPSWGLDRIDQRNLPLDRRYNYETTGTGTTVFVVDSGIRATHTTFGGRASGAANFVADGNGTNDCHGHGTHVAGTVAGSSYGVAKSVRVRAVRVLDCNNSGLNSDLIAGMDWIAANHGPRSIANFSLQGYGTATNTAAERLLTSGVYAVFIANNFDTDACTNAPRSPRGLVVAASDRTDARAAFSSYGTCVDVFAPGVDIVSASHLSDTGSATFSGTSMAAPHVSGWVARYLQTHPAATLAAVKNAVIANSTRNVLTNVGPGSPNRLLHSPLRVPARSGA